MSIRPAAPIAVSDLELFLLTTPDDTEDAPWMVMGTPQVNAVDVLKAILQEHARQRALPWVIESYLAIRILRPDGTRTLIAAPELLVARGTSHDRGSWDVFTEGNAPSFVLEASSKDSWGRDTDDKPRIYAAMGAQEYVIFAPARTDGGPWLFGYRRDDQGEFVLWQTDDRGLLWSRALDGLGLYVEEGRWLRLVDQQGQRLLTPSEQVALETQARSAAEVAHAEETAKRQAAEAELARLRAELRRRGIDLS